MHLGWSGNTRLILDPGRDGRRSVQAGELLLQIFSEDQIGPLFFEIIQRRGNMGFGEGNFQALYDSIELDQKKRGVL